jgi:hypothetical protein
VGFDSAQLGGRAAVGESPPSPDPALTDQLTESLADVLPGLEQFLRFDGPDPATRRSTWLPALDQPLPATGIGPERTIARLRDEIVAAGLRTGTRLLGHDGATTIATVADRPGGRLAAALRATPANLVDTWRCAGHRPAWLPVESGRSRRAARPPTWSGSALRGRLPERPAPSIDGIAGLPERASTPATETLTSSGGARRLTGCANRSIPVDGDGRIDSTSSGRSTTPLPAGPPSRSGCAAT